MLETLDQVDWQKLGHAYGEASDVPELIRGLASDDQAERNNAIYALYGNIWHQGTVYEASAYAVPFLIELLGEPQVRQKEEILLLLQALGTGNSYLDVHGSLDWYRNERNTPEFAAQVNEELKWVQAAHEAVVSGTPVYIALLSDADSQLRATAPVTLAICVERAAEVLTALKNRLDVEPDPAVRACLLRGLDHIARRSASSSKTSPPPEQLALYAECMGNAGESPLVRFMAALLWMRAAGRTAFDEALSVVRETLEEVNDSFPTLPGADESSVPFAEVAWALADDPERQREWLLEGLDRPKHRDDALWVIEEICRYQRSQAAALAPRLVEKLASADGPKKALASVLACVGEAAIEPLRRLEENAAPPVQRLAREVLSTIQERRAQYELDRWLRFPKGWQLPMKALKLLQGEKADRGERQLAIAGLGNMGPKARIATPLLRLFLEHEDQWLRGYAAWALWKIEHDPELVLPTLVEDLRCRPVGLIILDCLSDMGREASPAIPKLREMIDSDFRLVEIGSTDDWAHEDDMFRAACQRTLAAIEADQLDSP